ncbi:MAG: glycosyltransferase family 39 protein [Anaerolineae bacterium]|nr:glycosyltransferase family 39 protein [Anaerolineae bacterium]
MSLQPGSNKSSSARLRWGLLMVLVLLAALVFRAYNLEGVPPGLDGDEMFNAWDGLRAWSRPFSVFVPTNYGSETTLIYLIALTTKVLSTTRWTIRLPSALCGLLTVAMTWAFAKRLFGLRVAILAGALVAVSVWPVFLSRVALRAVLQPLFQIVAIYALWRALEARSTRWSVAAGVFLGLTQYTYTASRLFPLAVIGWLLVALLNGRHLLRANWGRLVLIGAVAILVVVPLALYAAQHWDVFSHRVSETDKEFGRLLAGNPGPVWKSFKATLGMFTVEGDSGWRYNPSGRPVFDPVTGTFFYLGLVVSLCRLRRPAYSLLLVWLPVMLLPGILATGAPSFWRSVGALTPIYLMPAIGADFVWERVAHWSQRCDRRRLARWVLALLVVVGLGLIGVDTWHDYFVDWPTHPEVLSVYEADVAAAAGYLDEHVPADTPVWISTEYPGDLGRVLIQLQSGYSGPVRFFDGNYVTVWPSGMTERDVVMIFTQSCPPNPDALAVLGDYLVYEEDDASGQQQLWVYRIPGEALYDDIPWRFEHAVSGRFVHDREVLGVDAPARVQRQTVVPVVVYWRVPPDVQYDTSDLPFGYACLQDVSSGRCADKADHYNVYPMWDWTEGDVVAQRYMVPVQAYVPPQTTYFQVGMFTSVGEISFAGESGGRQLLVGPVEVEGTASVKPKWKEDTPTFNQELALFEYHMLFGPSPGSTLEVDLRWQAMQAPTSDYVARLELRGGDDVVASVEGAVGSGRHPTSQWVSGEPVHMLYKVQIPADLESGEFGLYLLVLDGATGQVVGDPVLLGMRSISGRAHTFDLPDPQHPLSADFGSDIRLLGFDLVETAPNPGGQIEVVLYWQALGEVERGYKVFVHLYNPADTAISGQHDSAPGNGAFLTESWLPGEVVADPHVIAIEPGADVGVGKVGAGLYDPSTGERLPVFVDDQEQAGGVLIIAEVEVR